MNDQAREGLQAELAACQARLADCEAKLAGLINNPNDFIWAIDSNYCLTVMNDNFQATYRSTYQVELAVGDSVLEIVHPHLAGQWRSLYTRALGGERIVEQHAMDDGDKQQFFDVFLHPIKQGNTVTGAAVFLRDITAKKKIERQVYQLNQMYEMIIENTNVWITVQDCAGGYVIWNQGAEAISGYLQEEVNANPQMAHKLFPDEKYRQYVKRQMDNVRKGQVLDNLYLSIRTKRGEQRILSVNARRIVDEAGQCEGISQIAFDITEHEQREKELTSHANTDSLTGVLNRRAGLDALRRLLQEAVQTNTTMCVCYADMDGLKNINDTYGHSEGDTAILAIANTITATIRQPDMVCRLGGDEFLMVLSNCPLPAARLVRDEIRRRLTAYCQTQGKPYAISASIGLCEYNPLRDETCCAEELLAQADRDMYQEKWASVKR